MDMIKAEDLNIEDKKAVKSVELKLFSKKELSVLKKGMDKPVGFMQDMAVKLKNYIDYRIAVEMNDYEFISDNTRKWVITYNDLLDRIQKSLYGTKSMSVNLHKIAHSDMAAAMRANSTDKVINVESEEVKK